MPTPGGAASRTRAALVLGLVHADRTPVERRPVHLLTRLIRSLFSLECDESKTFAPARVAVYDDPRFYYGSELLKGRLQRPVIGAPTKTAHK